MKRKKPDRRHWDTCPRDGAKLDRWGGCTKEGCSYMTPRWHESPPKTQPVNEAGRTVPMLAEEYER